MWTDANLTVSSGWAENTQMTVNNQMVVGTLMNLADNPTRVSIGQEWRESDIVSRVPIIVTGNDLSTVWAPLIRDGRMDKFYWYLQLQHHLFVHWFRSIVKFLCIQFSYSTGLLVGSWFPIGCFACKINHFFPLVIHVWRKCLNLKKSNLFRFVGRQTHFSTFWHDKWMSLTLTNLCRMFSVQTSTLIPSMHQKHIEHERCGMQNNQLPTRGNVDLKG